jgi:EmrB/QacA subfamily drug resistance transporter
MATRIRIVPLVVATALFMEQIDSTILTTALPTIARDLGVDPIALKLAVTSYLVALAVFIPVSGRLADRLGARTIFRAALAVFMAASIGCAFSKSLGGFVVWRFLQGMGGALMVPVGRLVIVRSVPKAELVAALATLTIPSLMGPLLGPPIGGFIVTTMDWRWIFFVNLPVGVAGIILATIFFTDEPAPTRPLDIAGFFLSAIGLSGVILGTAMLGRHIAPTWVALLLAAVGAVSLAGYVRHARVTPRPLIDLGLLRLPTFNAGVLGGSLFRIGIGASAFLVPLMLQLAFGYNALASGLTTLAGAAGSISMKFLAGRVLRVTGFRRLLVVNGALASATLLATALLRPATPHLAILAVLFLGGLLRSLQFTCLNAITYADVEPADISAATSFASVAQQVSISLGVAIGALALEASQWFDGNATPGPRDFSFALVVVAVASFLSVVPMRRLDPDAGAEVSGRRTVATSE